MRNISRAILLGQTKLRCSNMLNMKSQLFTTEKAYISGAYTCPLRDRQLLQGSCSPCGNSGIQAVSILWLPHLKAWPPQLLQHGERELESHMLALNALAQEGTYHFCLQFLKQNQSHEPCLTTRQGRKYCHSSCPGRRKQNGFQYHVDIVSATGHIHKMVTGGGNLDLKSEDLLFTVLFTIFTVY